MIEMWLHFTLSWYLDRSVLNVYIDHSLDQWLFFLLHILCESVLNRFELPESICVLILLLVIYTKVHFETNKILINK